MPSMDPLSLETRIREERLHDGLCPNCGTRLFKVQAMTGSAGGHSGLMQKFFKKKQHTTVDNGGEGGGGSGNNHNSLGVKMTPLTIPGVVERGQCLKCVDGNNRFDARNDQDGVERSPTPALKSISVATNPAMTNVNNPFSSEYEIDPSPAFGSGGNNGGNSSKHNDHHIGIPFPPFGKKNPPEDDLLGVNPLDHPLSRPAALSRDRSAPASSATVPSSSNASSSNQNSISQSLMLSGSPSLVHRNISAPHMHGLATSLVSRASNVSNDSRQSATSADGVVGLPPDDGVRSGGTGNVTAIGTAGGNGTKQPFTEVFSQRKSCNQSEDSDDEAADTPLIDLRMSKIDLDQTPYLVVDGQANATSGIVGGDANVGNNVLDEFDNRKPAAKPPASTRPADDSNTASDAPPSLGGGQHSTNSRQQISIEKSAERIRKLRMEAAAAQSHFDASFLKSSNAPGEKPAVPPSSKTEAKALKPKWECPPGMSPDVFYSLPPEMQQEVSEQGMGGSGGGTKSPRGRGVSFSASSGAAASMDPETLASLPENIRREVLDQARHEAHGQQAPNTSSLGASRNDDRRAKVKLGRLSKSTAQFLTETGIDANDFANFPEEVRNDIIAEQKGRRPSSQGSGPNNAGVVGKKGSGPYFDAVLAQSSGYDPEMLASLPEDVRREVLDQELREREERSRNIGVGVSPSSGGGRLPTPVGAHSVNVPAGYDPETFAALPEYVQNELLEDAARANRARGSNGGGNINSGHVRNSSGYGGGEATAGTSTPYAPASEYDYDSILDAVVVPAKPVASSSGQTTSCTYMGEYNDMGKRHGDGELRWANGDRYVGKFKDGYIEGRGTINFHDGTEYAGQWSRNRFHGEGTRRFNNGNVYTGNYVDGKRQGQGRCYFANGDMYVGDWKDDTIHGFGRYYYNNGHSFEGMFRNGKRNGRGKYQLTDGRVEIYRYVNDARVGDGVRWSANRKKAWRMVDGKVRNRVSMEEAAGIAKRCGPVVEQS